MTWPVKKKKSLKKKYKLCLDTRCLKHKISKLIINISLLSSVKRVRDSSVKKKGKEKKRELETQHSRQPLKKKIFILLGLAVVHCPKGPKPKARDTMHKWMTNLKAESWNVTKPPQRQSFLSSVHYISISICPSYFILFGSPSQFSSFPLRCVMCTKSCVLK